MTPPASPERSRIRQRIQKAQQERLRVLHQLLRFRGPLLRGTFVRQGRRCGKPTCRCTRGELHPITFLSVSEGGRRRNLYVPAPDRTRVEQMAQRYRRFRKLRAQLARLDRHTLELLDALQKRLLQTYPWPGGTPGGRRRSR